MDAKVTANGREDKDQPQIYADSSRGEHSLIEARLVRRS